MSKDSVWMLRLAAAILLFSISLPTPLRAQALRFSTYRDYTSGSGPVSVAVGDFNGDRVQDLASANYFEHTVSVLLGNGDGTFQPPRAVSLGANAFPRSVTIGDFNRDSRSDLAVANAGANSVSVLLGNGDGTFQAPGTLGVDGVPAAAAVGDFNSDGNPDLGVANFGANSVSILLGNGDGTFGIAQTLVTDINPLFVALGDFNRDNRLDLAVANFGATTVSIFLGNGDGSFQPATAIDVGGNTVACVTVTDVNRDGLQDLVTANYGSNTISVLLGAGDATFQTPRPFEAGSAPMSVGVGDFDLDGTVDLAVANRGFSTVSLLFGNNDGTFQDAQGVPVGSASLSVAVGDFNTDGRPDLAVANIDFTTISLLLGTGDGTFPTAPTVAVGANPQSIGVADFNQDGQPDLAVANAGSNTVSVLLGAGDGMFAAALTFGAGAGPTAVAVGDFNGDGRPDLVATNYGSSNYQSGTVSTTVSLLLGNGDGTFQPAQTFEAGDGPNAVAVGDFNRDGVQDLAVADLGPATQRATTVSVLLGNGDGTFGTPQMFTAGNGPSSVAIGDFNRDGVQDLAVSTFFDDSVSVLLGNGDGTFQAASIVATGGGPWAVTVSDLNGDHVPDLAVANYLSDTVSVLLGNGDGSFQPPLYFSVGLRPFAVAAADFNGDGVRDLALANVASTTVSVLLGNGDGTFQPRADFGVGTAPAGVGIGDFNRDGRPDLAAANHSAANVSILINSSPPPSYLLTVSKLGNGAGSVTSTSSQVSASQIDCGAACSASYDSGTVVTLTAQPDMSSTFSSWSGCDMVAGTTCTVSMNSARAVSATFALQRFALTVSKTGTGDGIVSSTSNPASASQIDCGTTCSASYDISTVVTLTAQADTTSSFINWSGCDTVSGTTCTVMMSAARSVSATFDRQRFAFTVIKAGSGGGIVSSTSSPASPNQIDCGANCSASYESGTVVTLTAQADPSSTFIGWSGCDWSADAICTVGMYFGRSVTATFDRQRVDLTVSKAGNGGGTVTSSSNPSSLTQIHCGSTCSASYDIGTVVTLTAQADATSTFINWNGCDTVADATCTVTMSAARAVTATFQPLFTLSVSKPGLGSGTVTSSPAGIACGADCSQSYVSGTGVTLTAVAASGSAFTGWSGCDTVTGATCTVAMNAVREVTATFQPLFMLTVNKGGLGAGTVTSSPAGITCGADCLQSYVSGTGVTLTAVAASGAAFTGWSGCDTVTGATCTVAMNAVREVTATFQPLFLLTVSKGGLGAGTVTSNPAGISCGADCSQSYVSGTGVTLTAVAASGSAFTGWNGCDTVSGTTCTVAMNVARAVTATFQPLFLLTVSQGGLGTGTVTSSPAGINCGADCSQSYVSGTGVTLTAIAAGGSAFTGWNGCDTVSGTSCTVAMNAARAVTATFQPVFTLSVSKVGLGAGTVTSSPAGISCGSDCSQSYVSGTSVTLTAVAAAGSAFTGWSGCNAVSGAICTVAMNATRGVTATFQPLFTLTVRKAGLGSGTVTSSPAGISCGADCSQPYVSGTVVTLTATANLGSVFLNGWSGCDSVSGTFGQICRVTMGSARSVTATFVLGVPSVLLP